MTTQLRGNLFLLGYIRPYFVSFGAKEGNICLIDNFIWYKNKNVEILNANPIRADSWQAL